MLTSAFNSVDAVENLDIIAFREVGAKPDLSGLKRERRRKIGDSH